VLRPLVAVAVIRYWPSSSFLPIDRTKSGGIVFALVVRLLNAYSPLDTEGKDQKIKSQLTNNQKNYFA
jgi:hypothetical protein